MSDQRSMFDVHLDSFGFGKKGKILAWPPCDQGYFEMLYDKSFGEATYIF